MEEFRRKRYFRFLWRLAYLYFGKGDSDALFVEKSYDRVSGGYDDAWTGHMRDLTESLVENLRPHRGDTAIDLTCGTGFATGLLAGFTASVVVGVDASRGMLAEAEKKYGDQCKFVHSDILEFLKAQPTESADIITCCWGLGYSRPFAVLRQIKRVLKPGGKVAIIDNSLFSLREIISCSFHTFAEFPDKLVNLMRFKFLTGRRQLALYFRLLRLKGFCYDGGERSYNVASGSEAIERLKATGAAAGFEYAANQEDTETVFKRFAEVIEEKHLTPDGIKITHRYFAGIGRKC